MISITEQLRAKREQQQAELKEQEAEVLKKLPQQLNTAIVNNEEYDKFYQQAKNWIETFNPLKGASPKEIKVFLEYAASEKLNPFKNEIYFLKFGDSWAPVTNYRVYLQRMWESGKVTMFNVETTPVLNENNQKIDLKCVVTIKREEMEQAAKVTGLLSEYNKNQGTWNKQPTLMLEKSVIVKALRWYFADFMNLPYTDEEDQTDLSKTIDIELKDIENVEEAILVEETNQGAQND